MRCKSVLVALFFFMPLSLSAAPNYKADTDYRNISPALPTGAAPGKIQMLELFWYGCPHCYQMEPAIQAWLKKKAPDVEFDRVPAVFNRTQQDGKTLHPWFLHAKAYYAAQALGVGEKIHGPLFRAIHDQNKSLRNEQELAAFFAQNGVAEKEFLAAFNSFAVEAKVVHAMDITKRSGITGVPALIVNGKYQVLGKRATSYEDYLAIADFLIGRERASR